jgi:hypothetical protein
MTKAKKTIEQIAEQHWTYTRNTISYSLQVVEGFNPKQLKKWEPLLRHLYTESFAHGYKHAKENK